MTRAILILICCVLGAAAMGIVYLATLESYQRDMRGQPIEATVTEIRDDSGVVYEFLNPPDLINAPEGEVTEGYSEAFSASQIEQLSVGSTITVLVNRVGGSNPEMTLHAPSVLWPIGAILLIGLGVAAILHVRIVRQQFARAAGNVEATLLIGLRRSRTETFAAGIALLVMGGFIGFVALAARDAGVGGMIFLLVLALGALAFAATLIRRAIGLWHPEQSTIMRTLTDTPEDVVWVYEHVAEGDLNATHTAVMICTRGGAVYPVSLGETGVEEFVAALRERLPHAVFGYDADRARAFREDPAALPA